MPDFRVSKDHRVFLDGIEVHRCMGFTVNVEAGEDPEVVLRVSCDSVTVEEYKANTRQTELRT